MGGTRGSGGGRSGGARGGGGQIVPSANTSGPVASLPDDLSVNEANAIIKTVTPKLTDAEQKAQIGRAHV